MGKLIHEKLSGEIIGAAMDVLNEMKPGLDEKLYERAPVIELRKRGHCVESKKKFPVLYQNELIGNLTPDLIVDEKVIVDPKSLLCLMTLMSRRWLVIWQSPRSSWPSCSILRALG
jgi:GxxExxY protein